MIEVTGRLVAQLDALDSEPIDWRFKGFPAISGVTIGSVAAQGWNLLAGDLPLPALVLKQSALDHNLDLMAAFCAENRASIAPHGKTTMSPHLFRRQLEAGAWAITVANHAQARICRAFGIPRILIANEVIDPAALRWLGRELDADPSFDCYCLVDSVAAAKLMNDAIGADGRDCRRRLPVLIEIGAAGGRAGCRSLEETQAVAIELERLPHLELAGVETFEGVLDSSDRQSSRRAVDELLERTGRAAEQLAAMGLFDHREEILVSAGGSVFFDRVVESLSGLELGRPHRLVLRSGCYLTHDSGVYEDRSPFGAGTEDERRLLPALEAWGDVLSRPETELAIVGFGRRDVPYDAGLPQPTVVATRDGDLRACAAGTVVASVNDQHAFVHVPRGEPLAVGELLGCGISHPCTAFDKWPLVAIVDDSYTVVGAVRTFF